nr:tyrosine protein kinase Src42A [Hymenolepis microstoma]
MDNMSGSCKYVFALYSYDGVEPGDLSFKAGDLLGVAKVPTKDECWVQAVNPRTGCKGDVPANYVTAEQGYSAALDVFKPMDRFGAETLLNSPLYEASFNYVIRPSRDNKTLALSVKNPPGGIKHFKFHFDINRKKCFIFQEEQFDTIEDLIIHYMDNPLQDAGTLQAYKPFNTSPPKANDEA